jgi:hypothetical protein
MRLFRFARDLKDLRGTYQDLAAEAARADDEASYKLTLTARGFARRSRRVVDDKLSFSATLMRAGEVQAANRLLDEVHTEVITEEAALMEQVAEAKVAQAVRREKMTRLRLVRLMAVAVVGCMLMGLSAVGMAAVSYLDDRERDARRDAQAFLKVASVEHELQAKKLTHRLVGKDRRVKGILMKLSMADLRTLGLMTHSGDFDALALKEFLVDALPSPALADDVIGPLLASAPDAPVLSAPVVEKTVEDTVALVDKTRKRAQDEAKQPADEGAGEGEETTEEAHQPTEDETPADEKQPPEDEESSPTLPPNGPFNGGSQSGKEGDGGLLD